MVVVAVVVRRPVDHQVRNMVLPVVMVVPVEEMVVWVAVWQDMVVKVEAEALVVMQVTVAEVARARHHLQLVHLILADLLIKEVKQALAVAVAVAVVLPHRVLVLRAVLGVVLDYRVKEAPVQAEAAPVLVAPDNFMVAAETPAPLALRLFPRLRQILELQPGHKALFVLFGVLIEHSQIH
jgi:hypothetical protein